MGSLGFDLNSDFVCVHSFNEIGIKKYPLSCPYVFFSKNFEEVHYLCHDKSELTGSKPLEDIFFKNKHSTEIIQYLHKIFDLLQQTWQSKNVDSCILSVPYQLQNKSLDCFRQWGKVKSIEMSFLWRPTAIYLGQSANIVDETVAVIDVLNSAAVITFLSIQNEPEQIICHIDRTIWHTPLGLDSLLSTTGLPINDFKAFAGIMKAPYSLNWFSLYNSLLQTNYIKNWAYFIESEMKQTFHKYVFGGFGPLYPGLKKELRSILNNRIFAAQELPGHECAAGCLRMLQLHKPFITVFNFNLILKAGNSLFNLGKLNKSEHVYLKLKSLQIYDTISLTLLAGHSESNFEGPVFGTIFYDNREGKKEIFIKVIKEKDTFTVYIESIKNYTFSNSIL